MGNACSIYDARFPFKHSGAMDDSERERRMAAFLARQPRNRRTLALVQSLTGDAIEAARVAREKEEHRLRTARMIARQKRDKERYQAWVDRGCQPLPLEERKTRMAPGARKRRERAESQANNISPRLASIAEIQGMLCASCGKPMLLTAQKERERATLDHVLPRCAGGRDTMNLVAMHSECNQWKGSRLPNGCELIWLAAVNARLTA